MGSMRTPSREHVRGVAPLHPRPLFGSNRFPFTFEHGLARVISAQTVDKCQHPSRPVLHLTVSSAPHPQTSDLCVPHASFDMGGALHVRPVGGLKVSPQCFTPTTPRKALRLALSASQGYVGRHGRPVGSVPIWAPCPVRHLCAQVVLGMARRQGRGNSLFNLSCSTCAREHECFKHVTRARKKPTHIIQNTVMCVNTENDYSNVCFQNTYVWCTTVMCSTVMCGMYCYVW